MNDRILEIINKDEKTVNFITMHQLSKQFVLDNIFIFYDNIVDLSKCANCNCLKKCLNKNLGHYSSYSLKNNVLYSELKACDFYIQEKNNNAFLNNFVYIDIPLRYRTLNKKDIILDENNKSMFKYIGKILNDQENNGLYICGDVGVGKSFAGYFLAIETAKKGLKVAFIKVNEFINKMRDYRISNAVLYNKLINDIKKADLVIFDDIGSSSNSEFVRDDLLFNIFDYRMENKLLTVFISNLSKDNLKKYFETSKDNNNSSSVIRIMERIDKLSKISIKVPGDNRRI